MAQRTSPQTFQLLKARLNTILISGQVPLILSTLDRVQNWLHGLVGEDYFTSLQPFSYHWNVATLLIKNISIFY